jgi:hypothetical protein
LADALPAGIRKIFDDVDVQTARWRSLCSQVAKGADAIGNLARRAQSEPTTAQNFAVMVANLAGFTALQDELVRIIGNKP